MCMAMSLYMRTIIYDLCEMRYVRSTCYACFTVRIYVLRDLKSFVLSMYAKCFAVHVRCVECALWAARTVFYLERTFVVGIRGRVGLCLMRS